MIITIIILSITILIFFISTIIFGTLAHRRIKVIDSYENMLNNKEIFPCTLFVKVRFNQPQHLVITDFSHYETEGYINYTIDMIGSPGSEGEACIAERTFYLRNALLYKFEGEYYWMD